MKAALKPADWLSSCYHVDIWKNDDQTDAKPFTRNKNGVEEYPKI
jgi:hypothetical protein